MKKNIFSSAGALIFALLASVDAKAEDYQGSYEIIGLDEASYPRYDGGWAPGSGHEVEFSGWTQVIGNEKLVQKNEDIFSLMSFTNGTFPLRMSGGSLEKTRAFAVGSEKQNVAYAQREINQTLGSDEMLSTSLLFGGKSHEESGEEGMVLGKKVGKEGYKANLALVRKKGHYFLVDGEGVLDVGEAKEGVPLGASFIFLDDGSYTLQLSEMKDEGEIIDIGPRKTIVGGGRGNFSIAFFAQGENWISFDDLQIEKFFK